MLRAREVVFQLRHLLLRAIQCAAEVVGEAKIDSRPVHFGTSLELGSQSLVEPVYRHADFLQQWPSYAFTLI